MARCTAAVLVLVLAATAVAMAPVAGGDMSADKTECADTLVGLAPCLLYRARAPPPDCCGGLRQVLGKSPKYLCVLVRDRDDPSLGIKISATLGPALPKACGATQLLHIPPGSKDAAVFRPGGDKGSTAAQAKDNSTATTDSRALLATNGGGVSTVATTGVALTVLLASYLLLVPELSPSSF